MFVPSKAYYLALGDSVAYGYQQAKVDAGLPPSAFDTGYVDDLAARLRTIRPRLRVVNLSCPGESTASFIAGPCTENALGFPLHDPFSGSQLAAATAFLRAHRGRVTPITLTLGGADISQFVEDCGADPACIRSGAPAETSTLASNLHTILAKLRAAAPDAEIIVTGAWGRLTGSPALADPLEKALDISLAAVTATERARFANPYPVLNAICTRALTCTDREGQPTNAGYQTLADLVFDSSRYARAVRHGCGPASHRRSCPS
jgi:lysophospholipase L1-like esterase